MIRRPPRSTLFPYTTSSDLTSVDGESRLWLFRCRAALGGLRSEEHTSELQSLTNLVCRLLLEKKNNKDPQRDHEKDEDHRQFGKHAEAKTPQRQANKQHTQG